MLADATNYYTVVSKLIDDTEAIFQDGAWDEYEELLDRVAEAAGWNIFQ